MGGIVGGITDAIGLTNHKGEEKAAKSAAAAQAAGTAMSKEQIALMKQQLEFQKDQYEDWKNIYGDLQENLGDYYKDMNAEDITAMGLTNQQREYQAAVKMIETEAAQRGISGSGMEFAAKSAATFSNATVRAKIRTDAPEVVASRKMGFLGLGLGQGTQMLGAINQAGGNANSAFATGVNFHGNMAGNYISQQTNLSNANTDAMGQIVGSAMGWASGGASMGYRPV